MKNQLNLVNIEIYQPHLLKNIYRNKDDRLTIQSIIENRVEFN